jgi:NAD(P)-dependent dehydrogenase (short-subunit alcohol dehydrogenase family)
MKVLREKVAVVTGAASGIGRALCARFAKEGMKVVLADVEEAALAQAESELRGHGATTLAVRTDVSRADEVQALADRTLGAFGAVHVVCNNAGVAAGGLMWEHAQADWEWLLGVNLWGPIHGCRVFVPILLSQNEEAHVVNTASMAGLVTMPLCSMYNVSKQGVVALSESLAHDLALVGAKVKVSVLCPGFVNTRIVDADRNRPEGGPPSAMAQQVQGLLRQAVAAGLDPSQVADDVVSAIHDERFYIFTHPPFLKQVRQRMEGILAQQNPTVALANPKHAADR